MLISIPLVVLGAVCRAVYLSSESELLPSYDFIVVGGGTAGSTISSRLSETNATVLLIEAGSVDKGEDYVLIPRRGGGAIGTVYDWNYTTVAMPTINNRTIRVAQGRVIGGSSVLNGMLFDRGAASDYDSWGELGSPGWNWTELLPFFKKSETFTPPDADSAAAYNITWDWAGHGTDGPIHASYPTVFPNIAAPFIKAYASLGAPKEFDGNNGRALNTFWAPNTIHGKNKTRSYARNYVELGIGRTNYHVLTNRQVTKLITEKGDLSIRVSGVEFTAGVGLTKTIVKVNKEVIVSGGAVGSPRLLQLSGIGPAAALAKANVTTVIDLPGVGTNYQDHATQSILGSLSNPPAEKSWTEDEARKMWNDNRTGPWTSFGPTSFAFIPLPTISNRTDEIISSLNQQAPDAYLRAGSHPTVVAGYGAQKKVLAKRLATKEMAATEFLPSGNGMFSQQHPLSRGYIEITSSDPFVYPTLDFRYITNPADLDILVESIRFLRRVMQTPDIVPLKWTEATPGATKTSDDDLKEYIRTRMSTMAHSCCTNPMQPLELGGVVDAKLKVYGTSNLRVADVSIMPLIPGTHLQSSAYAIGEKAADIIKSAA